MKIAVAGLHTECSTYNPVLAREADFRVLRGPSMLKDQYFDFLTHFPAEFVTILHARAIAGGPVERALYDRWKAEILDGLNASGTAVLNRDDKAYSIWAERAAGKRIVSFGLDDPLVDFSAGSIAYDQRGCPNFVLTGPLGNLRIQLNLLGRHNVANALAAAAAAYALGIGAEAVVAGLESLQPVKGRAVAQMLANGVRLIDDSYNANPASICAAIDVLASFAGRTILVLGDMGELGEWAEQGHRDVGAYAAGKIDTLYAVGPLMAHAIQAFGPGARHFADQASLIDSLRAEQGSGTTILIKGSRSAAMDKVVDALAGPSMEKH